MLILYSLHSIAQDALLYRRNWMKMVTSSTMVPEMFSTV